MACAQGCCPCVDMHKLLLSEPNTDVLGLSVGHDSHETPVCSG